MRRARSKSSPNRGFTLIEVLVALVVTGTAVTVFLSMFTSSLRLSRMSRDYRVACELAEEQLDRLLTSPELFDWHESDLAPGVLVEVGLRGDDFKGSRRFEVSSAVPAIRRVADREREMYRGFTWKAYVRMAEGGGPYVEVTVAIHWDADGRERVFVLDTLASRGLVAGTPEGGS